jgi:c-di-GMP-binding flagellar brake protein YcgR
VILVHKAADMSEPITERRRYPRYACRAEVEFEWGSEVLRAVACDMSATGMFLLADNPLWVRAEFTARILAADSISVECIVKRVEPGRGMGLEFRQLPAEAQKALDAFLWKLAGK